ncbi:Tm-1-like ATP-binding domain-containing protein [Planktotalea sp.]|uniref:Tm-1-like ATP-binding domain-containing protein n=1 Tax=Planktotalea sp. TaxID=2029877 RepID=UPI00329A64FA
MPKVIVLATVATKSEEADFLVARLADAGVHAQIIDISLQANGAVLGGTDKRIAMERAAKTALIQVQTACAKSAEVVVAIGGGTGGEIALQVLRELPITFPKVMVTTLPFDPRVAVADNSIILVPTLADVSGLNGMLRDVLENAALMTAGLCQKSRKGELTDIKQSVGITGLGATEGAIKPLLKVFAEQGREATVFHANGYGGAAFARFADKNAFDAIIDLTPHELTRIHLAGVHATMPNRFSAGGDLPRVVLPGALNFIGLGQKSLVQSHYLERAHYEHSGLFTHVKLNADEMRHVSKQLATHLNTLSGPCAVIVPMGGFSHQDCKGGPIEDANLRNVCLETLQSNLRETISITSIDAHIFDPLITGEIMSKLAELSA